jgi:hypothetical protein
MKLKPMVTFGATTESPASWFDGLRARAPRATSVQPPDGAVEMSSGKERTSEPQASRERKGTLMSDGRV